MKVAAAAGIARNSVGDRPRTSARAPCCCTMSRISVNMYAGPSLLEESCTRDLTTSSSGVSRCYVLAQVHTQGITCKPVADTTDRPTCHEAPDGDILVGGQVRIQFGTEQVFGHGKPAVESCVCWCFTSHGDLNRIRLRSYQSSLYIPRSLSLHHDEIHVETTDQQRPVVICDHLALRIVIAFGF